MCDLKIISWNVNGLNNEVKRKSILLYLDREGGDILFLQETHLKKYCNQKLKKDIKGQLFYSALEVSKRGVVIIIKSNINFEKEEVWIDKEGRYVMVIGKIESIQVTLLNVYYPPEQDATFMKQLIDIVVTKSKGVVIAGGDLNLTMNPKLDSSKAKLHRAEKVADMLRKACSELGFMDVWRTLHPNKKEYTFYSGRHSVYNRLDYFLCLKTISQM
uniref:exodeoxyribonuclease III n=1 Tax=Neogobius melanostomus TaxID=47308 RepID=A0A8C6S8Y0_9GOBI